MPGVGHSPSWSHDRGHGESGAEADGAPQESRLEIYRMTRPEARLSLSLKLLTYQCPLNQMIMISHQARGKHVDAPQCMSLTQHPKKGVIIGGVSKDRLASQPPVHHMIDRTGILDTKGAGRSPNLAGADKTINKRFDPSSLHRQIWKTEV